MSKRAHCRRRLNRNNGGIAHAQSRTNFHRYGIIVEGDGAHRRAKREVQIPHAPSRRIRIVRIVAVVRDDIPVNLLQSLGNRVISHLRQHFFRHAIVLHFSSIRKFPVRKIRIAAPHKNQIPQQAPILSELAGGFQSGAKLVRRPQRRQRQRRRDNFRVRRWRKKSVGVQLIQYFSAVAIRHQHAPQRFLRMRFLQRRIHTRPKPPHPPPRLRTAPSTRSFLRRRRSLLAHRRGASKNQQRNPPQTRRKKSPPSRAPVYFPSNFQSNPHHPSQIQKPPKLYDSPENQRQLRRILAIHQ